MEKQIFFCNKKAFLPTNNTIVELYKNLKYKLKYNFEEQEIQKLEPDNLKKNHYLVTFFNKEANHFLLYLTTLNNKKYCFFIEGSDTKKLKIYSIKFRFSQELYKGTLFSGELVLNNKKSWIYLISDIYYNAGHYVKYNKFSEKLHIISDIMKNKYKYDDFMNVCHIQMKSFFLYTHFELLKNNKSLNSYKILFIPENFSLPIMKTYINPTKKVEVIINNKMNFEIRNTDIPDVCELYIKKNNKIEFHSIACISKLKTSEFIKNLFKNNKNNNKIIVECIYSEYFEKWVPARFMSDLNEPSTIN